MTAKSWKFDPDKERRALEKFYLQLKDIVAATLKNMTKSEDNPSAAMLKTLTDSIKAMGSLLSDLEVQAEARERRQQAAKDREEAMSQLPTRTQPPGTTLPEDLEFINAAPVVAQAEPITLPFPLRGV